LIEAVDEAASGATRRRFLVLGISGLFSVYDNLWHLIIGAMANA
jgi:hypothetical protein